MVLETTATLVNLVPGIGGAISSVLFGISGDRRFERVRDFLVDVDARVESMSDEQDQFIRSEDFEDLLTEPLERVARERNEDKRVMYARFLAGVIDAPGAEPYDERLRFLRIMENLQADHLRILRAIIAEPSPPGQSIMSGSRRATLEARLPDIPRDRLSDLTEQLGDLRLIDAGMLVGMVTGPSAIDLRPLVTPLGVQTMARIRDSGKVPRC